jgi:hypothetical protein
VPEGQPTSAGSQRTPADIDERSRAPRLLHVVLHRFRMLLAADPSLVSYRHIVGCRRSPGDLASRVTRSIGECQMSLWSALVVSPPAAEPHDRLLRRSLHGQP